MAEDKNNPLSMDELDSPQENSSMTDEELARYLASLDDEPARTESTPEDDVGASVYIPKKKLQSTDDMDKTTVSDMNLLNLMHDTGNLKNQSEDATNVIPDDVRSIYEYTEKHNAVKREPKKSESKVPAVKNEQEPVKGEDPRDYRPIRRARRHRTGCMGGIMYFLFVVCVSVVLACLAWAAANDVLSLTKKEATATIVLPESIFTEKVDDEGETYTVADIDYVADKLKKTGIIEYKFLFKIFAKFSHAEKKVDPGEYTLSTLYDYRAIIAHLEEDSQYSNNDTTKVTVPEGKTMKQTFELLEEAGVCKADKLWESAANTDFQYDFLSADTLGDENRLEGYLFPDTYEFWINTNPDSVLTKFLDNFNSKFTPDMYAAASELGMDVNKIITVASLIEMEAANDDERPTIASVIYNRLNSDFQYLQIDASIQYILPERKESLSLEDLAIDNPYNTYLYPGLTPGPIANPGLASIKAALAPEDTNYLYYALNTAHYHSFFADYDSFKAFTESEDFGG